MNKHIKGHDNFLYCNNGEEKHDTWKTMRILGYKPLLNRHLCHLFFAQYCPELVQPQH
jgi:hypothetical protein